MSCYFKIPADLSGLSCDELRNTLDTALKRRDDAQDANWPALAASWQSDVDRIEAAMAAAK